MEEAMSDEYVLDRYVLRITEMGRSLMEVSIDAYLFPGLLEAARALYLFDEDPEGIPPWGVKKLLRKGYLEKSAFLEAERVAATEQLRIKKRGFRAGL